MSSTLKTFFFRINADCIPDVLNVIAALNSILGGPKQYRFVRDKEDLSIYTITTHHPQANDLIAELRSRGVITDQSDQTEGATSGGASPVTTG
ncbi:hypothetical protein FDECE_10083 [Fusarium decemcellulare]|nr:hypothetical protein FDECE_10083 [Fusarium decemcellulare]